MSGDSTVEQIDAVDSFARALYQRAKQISSLQSFADVAATLRQLHVALRHLRVEATDPDSLLYATESSVYARQLRPIVEDCGFSLQQLEAILNKYGETPRADDDGLEDRIAVIRAKLVNERTNVEMFLDTVQLRNPATSPATVFDPSNSSTSLEDIKDKVDKVANRVFSRPSSGEPDAEDGLWQEFKTELEKEGFSPQVLRKHKDVLRAYIRELGAMSSMNGGATPTVRGLLEYESRHSPSPKEMFVGDNEKCLAGMKDERRMPDHAPRQHHYEDEQPQPQNAHPNYVVGQPPYEHHSMSSEDMGSEASDSLALVSTRDLMAMDNLNSSMAALHVQPGTSHYSLSPSMNQKYLGSPRMGSWSGFEDQGLSTSANAQVLGTSPRTVPYPTTHMNTGDPPPPYGTSPGQRLAARLAPDRYGNEIPLDAHWTRIKRTLISSEVLERAGVRYEARPDYVAILGRLSREEIAEYARQSADCRAAREKRDARPRSSEPKYRREREDSKSSRDDDDNESILWDSSDSTDAFDDKTSDKGTKTYPYIVSPPDKKKASPSSTVQPKPILKNKNENHVRFDPEPREVEGKSPKSLKDRDDRDRRRESHRRQRDHRDHESSGRYRDGERRSSERERHGSDRHGDYHRRDYRDRKGDHKEERHSKKKAWGETLGAVGIGGAAVSLISVLAEAASGI
ncbi:hypothetical protein S40293_05483 [Stachybotrys chartarum IBT 40293]|nr:hypothetical protein S40293_05483 [Stachybotrys chartarum IBT 40293]KFA77486.1 hypothetical protein S40288_04244 [Stachybotrys chartarum IBT 40288]